MPIRPCVRPLRGNYNMKQLLGSEVHIESNIESWIIEYAEKTEQHKN